MTTEASSTFCADNWRERESKVVAVAKRTRAVSLPGNSMEVKVAVIENPSARRKSPKTIQYAVRKPVEMFSDDRAGGFVAPFICGVSVSEDFRRDIQIILTSRRVCVSGLDRTQKLDAVTPKTSCISPLGNP